VTPRTANFTADGDTAQRSFSDVVVDLEPAVAKEAGERGPALEPIGDRSGHLRLGREPAAGIIEHVMKGADQWHRLLLPGLAPRIGRLTPDLLLDGIKRSNPVEDVSGERRLGLMDIEHLATEVCPASDLGNVAGGIKRIIAGIGIGLEEAGKARQFALRVRTRTIGREPIPGERRRCCARRAIIDRIDPEPAGRGAASAGIEHGTGVSSAWILMALSPSSRMRAAIGSSSAAAWPAQPASVERSMSTPWAAIISA